MKAGRHNLSIVQGATFRQQFAWKSKPAQGGTATPVDLTGWTARSQVRIEGRPVLTFDSDDDSADGTITLGGTDGTIELYAPDYVVADKPAGWGMWSLELEPVGGDRVVLLTGRVAILKEITV